MSKFKVGERVRITKDYANSAPFIKGEEGVITRLHGSLPLTYVITSEIVRGEWWLHEQYLESATPAWAFRSYPDEQDRILLEVKIKRLHQDGVVPTYAKPGDAGMDLVAIDDGDYKSERIDFQDDDGFFNWQEVWYVSYKTGIALEIPQGYVGLIFPRSSISKTDLTLANSVGVIDSGYRGEISFRFKTTHGNPVKYKKGDKIGQLVVMSYPKVTLVEVEELSDTERGTGGFGSSGN